MPQKKMIVACMLGASLAVPICSIAQQPAAPAAATSQPAAANLSALRAQIERGHASDALLQLDLLAAKQPEAAGVERLRGLALYAEGKFADADQAFASAIRQDAKDAESVQLRGLTLFRLGKPADAIPLLERAHAWTSQTKADPNYVLALCYMETRRYDDARHALAQQYGFAPDSAPAYLLAARLLLRREYVPVAQESARKALELDPQLPLAHLLLGEIALAGEHMDEAIAEFEKERARNPLEAGIYDRLGDAYTRAGQYTLAEQSLQRALLLEPSSTGPYILLGKALLKQQDAVSAVGYLARAEQMDPANYITHSLLGQAYRLMGRTDDAHREMDTAEKLQAASAPKFDTPK